MNVLFFGDVCGKPGRQGLVEAMPRLRARFEPDLVVANGENTVGNPGHGHVVVEAGFMRVMVINLSGVVMLKVARSPFVEADALLARLDGQFDAAIVDFHAEITSEKVAMGWHLDGRVGAVFGTHTHVPAFISDVGMTGSRDGVLGARRDQVLESFRTQMPVRFDGAEGNVWIDAVAVELGDDGLARSIEQILEPASER